MSARRERYRQVVEVLTRHGLGFLAGSGLRAVRLPHSRPEHVRMALEELGPTFIKLGQIASTRGDVLPPEYVAELVRLQDAAPPVPVAEIRAVIEEELGQTPEELFATFDDEPLASASIGQAHAATVPEAAVVVKVRRPGAVEQVELDLEILHNLAGLAGRTWDLARDYDVVGLAEEFSATLRAELDYLREARNVERFAEAFADDERVHIPRVLWDGTTSRVLTLERVEGIKVSDLDALDRAGIDRRLLAVRATSILCTMIFEEGFFHADPHPGNFFIEPGGRIGIIDFGMVGRVDEELREHLVHLVMAISRRDARRTTTALLALCGDPSIADRAALTASLDRLVLGYVGLPLAQVPVAALIPDVLGLLRAHHLHLPRQMSLLLKTLVMADGLGKQLDPDFDFMSVLGPYGRRFVAHGFSPRSLARRLASVLRDALELGADAPDLVRRAMDVLERGGFDVHIRAAEIEPLLDQVERIGNRLVAGALAAALISGVGKIVSGDPARFRSWERPFLAVGFSTLGALGAYLAATSHRRGPRAVRF